MSGTIRREPEQLFGVIISQDFILRYCSGTIMRHTEVLLQ